MPHDRISAHILPDQPEDAWEPLSVHLQEVGKLAGSFATAFDSQAWGALAGLWHDLGKYKPEFQAQLRGSREQVKRARGGALRISSVIGLESFWGNSCLLRPPDELSRNLSQFLEREVTAILIPIPELYAEDFFATNCRKFVRVPWFADAHTQAPPAVAGVNAAPISRHALPLSGTRNAGLLDLSDSDHALLERGLTSSSKPDRLTELDD